MKFIVNAQLPKSLSDLLNRKGLDSIHTLELERKIKTTDNQILTIASKEERIVITKDTDFLESFIVKSIPQKLILVKTGNIHNKLLLQLFEKNLETLLNSLSRSNLIEISQTEIAEHG